MSSAYPFPNKKFSTCIDANLISYGLYNSLKLPDFCSISLSYCMVTVRCLIQYTINIGESFKLAIYMIN